MFSASATATGAPAGNEARVRDLLGTCLRGGGGRSELFSAMYLEGFEMHDRDGARFAMRQMLAGAMGSIPCRCTCCQEVLLDCSAWAPSELRGGLIWWRRAHVGLGGGGGGHASGVAYMILHSGTVASAPPKKGSVLHTFSVTRLSEPWVQSIRADCSRIYF